LLVSWLDRKRASKRELQSLIGKLVFISKCVRASRLFICRLLATLRSLKSQHHRFRISNQFKKDLLWWQEFLEKFNGVTYIPNMVWNEPDKILSTDACLEACGGWCNNRYFSSVFPGHILNRHFHINILELLTILVGLRAWGKLLGDQLIKVACDNQASVCVMNAGKSKDPIMLGILREIISVCVEFNIQLKAVHLEGVNNRTADKLSRAPIDNKVKLNEVVAPGWRRIEVKEEWFRVEDVI